MFEKYADLGNKYIQHQFMNGGKKFVCNLWKQYPDQWTGNKNIGGNWIQNHFNNLCDDPPPPPVPPFDGGQCPVVYDIYLREGDNPGQTPTLNAGRTVTFARLPGPITSATFVDGEFVSTMYVQNYLGIERVVEGGNRGPTYIRKILLSRADNQSDNCGSPPPVYPPTTPPQPGEETYDAPITQPGFPDFTIPLGWFDIDFELPVTINVGPPQLDITMEFHIDGVDLNFGPDKELPDGSPKPTGPGGEDKYSEDTFNNTEQTKDDLDNLTDIVDDIKDTVNKPPIKVDDYTGTEQPSEEDAQEEDEEIEFVRVDVIEVPKKGKTIIMDDPSDNVFFAGYFSWTVEDARVEDMRVRKSANIFVKPTWADGYRFYTVNGAKCKITSFRKKLTNPES